MEAIRIAVEAYTASFRVPTLVGHQLTLPVPPLATIYGLLSSASGRLVSPEDVEWLAYRCEYQSKGEDLEAIRTVERRDDTEPARFTGRNVILREFLLYPHLTLYLPPEWESVFRNPHYPLLLGRTQDVAYVRTIARAKLDYIGQGKTNGVLLPLEVISQNEVFAWLVNLPLAFSKEPYRKPRGVKIFGAIDCHQEPAPISAPQWLVCDEETGTVVPCYRKQWVQDGCR